jgi:hypothetical protein
MRKQFRLCVCGHYRWRHFGVNQACQCIVGVQPCPCKGFDDWNPTSLDPPVHWDRVHQEVLFTIVPLEHKHKTD